MHTSEIDQRVQYVTNAQGDKTAVLVPLAIWENLMNSWQTLLNAQADDEEPNEQILADLKESIRQAKAGHTIPLDELWNGIDV